MTSRDTGDSELKLSEFESEDNELPGNDGVADVPTILANKFEGGGGSGDYERKDDQNGTIDLVNQDKDRKKRKKKKKKKKSSDEGDEGNEVGADIVTVGDSVPVQNAPEDDDIDEFEVMFGIPHSRRSVREIQPVLADERIFTEEGLWTVKAKATI